MRPRTVYALLIGALIVIIAVVVSRKDRGSEPARYGDASEPGSPEARESERALDAPAHEVARTGVIAGRVTDERGEAHPIAGVSVCAVASSDKLTSADTKLPHCVTSDADGRFRIGALPPAHYVVDASASGYEPARYRDKGRAESFFVKSGATRDGVNIVLRHGGVEVRGRVKDIAGGVVSGAAVAVASGDVWRPTTTSFARTGSDGAFSVWTAAGKITAEAVANGYTRGRKEGIAPGQLIEIVLTPESVLQGRVVEAGTDTPVVGARVVAGAMRRSVDFETPNDSVLTDVDGRFRIAGLEPGRYKPTATSPHRWGMASESVLLGLTETSRDIVIEMQTAPSLFGRVEFTNKEPCRQGTVSLREQGTQNRQWFSTDGEGRVRVEGLLPATYTVEVSCRDAKRSDSYEPLVIRDTDVTAVWRVDGGRRVSGVVLDHAGKPVSDALVEARTQGKDTRQEGFGFARTAQNGTFEMRGLLTATYGFTVARDGAVPLKDPLLLEVDHDLDDVRITLPAGGGIQGMVVDGSGAPVSGVDVRAKGERFDWRGGQTVSRDDGSFSFPALRPGTYHVQAEHRWSALRAPGTKEEDSQGTVVVVTTAEPARVKLVVESQNGQIRGRVVDEQGVALSDAFVDAERESERAGAAAGGALRDLQAEWQWGNVRAPVLTDVDGNFTLTKLSPGSYTVRAFRKGGGQAVSESVKVGSSVTLKIRTEGSIAGTVVAAKGGPADHFSIAVRDDRTGLTRREAFVGTRGAWAIRELPAGDFIVVAEGIGRGEARATLAQGEKREGVAISLAPFGSIRGRVVSLEAGEGGQPMPVPNMIVYARAKGADDGMFLMDEESDHRNVTDADGRFQLSQAPSGRVKLVVFPVDWENGSHGEADVGVTIEAGREQEVKEIRVAKRRVRGELAGEFGFDTYDMPPGTDPDERKLVVSVVTPAAPAARAGLVAGDEIVSVDGYDVVGPNAYLFSTLATVAAGTSVKLGVRRGATLGLVAEHPRAAK